MSTIIAYINKNTNVGYMASDGNGLDKNSSINFKNKKIFKYSGNKHKELEAEGYNIIIGMAGNYKELETLRYYNELFNDFVPLNVDSENNHINRKFIVKNIIPKLKNIFMNQTECDSDIIMIISNKIYIIQSDYSVIEPSEDYYAIGTGEYYAFGALYMINELRKLSNNITFNIPFDTIMRLVIESSKYYPGIGGRIDILSTQ